MQHERRVSGKVRSLVLLFICTMVLFISMKPMTAQALLKVYNYGTDYSAAPVYRENLSDAGYEAGLWQDTTPGFYARWPVCTRELGSSPYNNMQTTTTGIINIVSHANDESMLLYPPPVGVVSYYSCLISINIGSHTHTLGARELYCTGSRQIQDAGAIPANMKLMVFQGCDTANTATNPTPIAKAAWAKGVDTSVGFAKTIMINSGSGVTIQEAFSSGYWSSLAAGDINSTAMDKGTARVLALRGRTEGYESHTRWGNDVRF